MNGRYVLLSIVLLPALVLSSARAGETILHKTPVRDIEPSVANTLPRAQGRSTLVAGPVIINALHDFYHIAGIQTMTGSIKLDRDSTIIDINRLPPLAYRLNDRLSFGAGLNMMYGPQEEKEVPRHPTFESDRILKLNTSEQGFGIDLGVFYELRTGTRLGVNYLSKVELQHNEISKTKNFSPLPVDGLSTADRQNKNPGLTLKMPQRVLMSGYHELNDRWAIMANLGWQDWSSLNRFAMETSSETHSKIITAVRSYEDTWHVALGCQYKLNYEVLLAGSAAYNSSLVKKENLSTDPEIGDTYRFSFGGQYNWKEILNLGLKYTFIWNTDHKSIQPESLHDAKLFDQPTNNALHILGANLTLQF